MLADDFGLSPSERGRRVDARRARTRRRVGAGDCLRFRCRRRSSTRSERGSSDATHELLGSTRSSPTMRSLVSPSWSARPASARVGWPARPRHTRTNRINRLHRPLRRVSRRPGHSVRRDHRRVHGGPAHTRRSTIASPAGRASSSSISRPATITTPRPSSHGAIGSRRRRRRGGELLREPHAGVWWSTTCNGPTPASVRLLEQLLDVVARPARDRHGPDGRHGSSRGRGRCSRRLRTNGPRVRRLVGRVGPPDVAAALGEHGVDAPDSTLVHRGARRHRGQPPVRARDRSSSRGCRTPVADGRRAVARRDRVAAAG